MRSCVFKASSGNFESYFLDWYICTGSGLKMSPNMGLCTEVLGGLRETRSLEFW